MAKLLYHLYQVPSWTFPSSSVCFNSFSVFKRIPKKPLPRFLASSVLIIGLFLPSGGFCENPFKHIALANPSPAKFTSCPPAYKKFVKASTKSDLATL